LQVTILFLFRNSPSGPREVGRHEKGYVPSPGYPWHWAGSLTALAQTPAVPPPNILNIETINIKPDMDGPYDKLPQSIPVCQSNSRTRRTSWGWKPEGPASGNLPLRLRFFRGVRKERGVAHRTNAATDAKFDCRWMRATAP